MKFTFYKQYDTMDCGPTCLKIISKFYGRTYSLQYLRQASYISREGVNLADLSAAAQHLGFTTLASKMSFEELDDLAHLPCILYWNQKHFIVIPPQNYDRDKDDKILIADPSHGLTKIPRKDFIRQWYGNDAQGIILELEPSAEFHSKKVDDRYLKQDFSFFLKYIKPYRGTIFQVGITMALASGLSLIFPFLAQSLVDKGINGKDISFVSMILIAQMALFAGSTTIEMIRGWLLLHLNSRISLSILSDFLRKLMDLPYTFFATKTVGDIQQRISDHSRLQSFLTGTMFSTLFSLVNMLVFSTVLFAYNHKIFYVFIAFSLLSVGWISFFMKRRKELDYERFLNQGQNQNVFYEVMNCIQDIKLYGSERTQRFKWERSQVRVYKNNIKGLVLNQHQQSGFFFLNQLKNFFISYICAKAVIDGDMTLGMMMSVNYIAGQVGTPINQLLSFMQSLQDAKISLERIGEIHLHDNEEMESHITPKLAVDPTGSLRINNQTLQFRNVFFRFGGPSSPFVLNNLSLLIPSGKVTAIVGSSGSGKTTLLKLLLKFYAPTDGMVCFGASNLQDISPAWWRLKCSSVMQDGQIFSDTITKNICVSENDVDVEKFEKAITIANLKTFIDELPLKQDTIIGTAANGISAGQRQRILIARAVYKDPDFLFFDEATSALDANNERIIMNNLQQFFLGRTAVIIAHRLITVRNADNIIVLEKGSIVEAGNHRELTEKRGVYYELVKNQLELS